MEVPKVSLPKELGEGPEWSTKPVRHGGRGGRHGSGRGRSGGRSKGRNSGGNRSGGNRSGGNRSNNNKRR